MHAAYSFHFLDTVSRELIAELGALALTPLNQQALAKLAADQVTLNARQGVYLLYHRGEPVYLGKADDVHERLRQHLRKMSGRANIDLGAVGYKALLLDKSMSTAANETVLIQLFQETYQGMWNGTGFGTKAPGKERDTTAPSKFDREHPIKADYPITGIRDKETVGAVFQTIKSQVPFVFRHAVDSKALKIELELREVPRTAESLVAAALASMEAGWYCAVLSYGLVVYRDRKTYGPDVRVLRAEAPMDEA